VAEALASTMAAGSTIEADTITMVVKIDTSKADTITTVEETKVEEVTITMDKTDTNKADITTTVGTIREGGISKTGVGIRTIEAGARTSSAVAVGATVEVRTIAETVVAGTAVTSHPGINNEYEKSQ